MAPKSVWHEAVAQLVCDNPHYLTRNWRELSVEVTHHVQVFVESKEYTSRAPEAEVKNPPTVSSIHSYFRTIKSNVSLLQGMGYQLNKSSTAAPSVARASSTAAPNFDNASSTAAPSFAESRDELLIAVSQFICDVQDEVELEKTRWEHINDVIKAKSAAIERNDNEIKALEGLIKERARQINSFAHYTTANYKAKISLLDLQSLDIRDKKKIADLDNEKSEMKEWINAEACGEISYLKKHHAFNLAHDLLVALNQVEE